MKRAFIKNLKTPIGNMLAVACNKALLLLDFEESKHLEANLSEIEKNYSWVENETSTILETTEKELAKYFKGTLKKFTIPLELSGTDFQKKVWKELLNINFGETKFYQEQAKALGDEKKVRAVANANGKNKISIIIPCHRVIGKNGKLTGYAGGLDKKKYLLDLEKKIK